MTTPLAPKDANLRGLRLLPLDTVRLLNSDFFALSTGDEFKAAVTLWVKSWAQIPAGTLPADEKILEKLSGADRAVWRKVKARALHGWAVGEDGRMHHPVLAEMARQAWESRQTYAANRKRDADRLREWRNKKGKGNASETRFTGDSPEEGNADETRKRKGVEEGVKSSSSNNASTDASGGAADDLARALRGVGFPDCSGTYPDLIEAKREGVTTGEITALAVMHAGKPLAYIVQAARGKRADARQRAAAKGEAPAVAADPAVRAEAEARHKLEDRVLMARSDFDHGLIDGALRDERIAAAKADFHAAFPAAAAPPGTAREGASA